MFQNDPSLIDLNSVPDGMTANDLFFAHKSTGVVFNDPHPRHSITELKADTIFENLGDILALERIKPHQYFQLKSMLNSSDRESQEMARKIITTHLQHV
jgi:hypothetical protein